MPVEEQVGGHLLDRRAATLLADVEREAFRIAGIGRQSVEPLPLHTAAVPARDAPQVELEIDTQVATRMSRTRRR